LASATHRRGRGPDEEEALAFSSKGLYHPCSKGLSEELESVPGVRNPA
jgi:hypothetical protein